MTTPLITTMLEQHPFSAPNPWTRDLAEAIAALGECEQVCRSCADACLDERQVSHLRRCIRTDLDCATICHATAELLLRHSGPISFVLQEQLRACLAACQVCGDECDLHAADHAHCRVCAHTCRRCQEQCNELLAEISAGGPVEGTTRPVADTE